MRLTPTQWATVRLWLSKVLGLACAIGLVADQIQGLNIHVPHWAMIALAICAYIAHSPFAQGVMPPPWIAELLDAIKALLAIWQERASVPVTAVEPPSAVTTTGGSQ